MKSKRAIAFISVFAILVIVTITISAIFITKVMNEKKRDADQSAISDNTVNNITPTGIPVTGEPAPTEKPAVSNNSRQPTPAPTDGTDTRLKNIEYNLAETTRSPELEKAIIADIGFTSAGDIESTRYYYNYIDLNEDGLEEVFVELVGPYTSGSGGDTGLIYTLSDDGFQLLQSFTLIRNPIIISNEKTNGWHDIIMEQSGGGIPAQLITMKFNGKKYPNPSDAEPVAEDAVIEGKGFISNDIAADFEEGKGLYLAPEYTIDDRKAVEECITSFFDAFEQGDYDKAAGYCTPEIAERYFLKSARKAKTVACPLDLVVENNLPVTFAEMKAYLPDNETGTNFEITEDMPTVNFTVSYTYKDLDGKEQSDGFYVCGVNLDGKWYLDGFSSGY